MADKSPAGGSKNEGEGSRSAARAFDEAQHAFAESGKVGPAARDAAKAVEGKTELDAVVAYLQALGKHAPRGG